MAQADESAVVEDALRDSPEQPFYIAATTSPARPRKTLKHNDTFAVFDSHGDIGASPGGPDGMFDHDTRFLSHLELSLNGAQPLLLGSSVRDDNLHLHVDLTNPDLHQEGMLSLPHNTIHLSRILYLHDGMLRERIMIHNHNTYAARLTVTIAFDSDFADIFEVRGTRRCRRGRALKRLLGPNDALLVYEGLDNRLRETALCFEPAPTRLLTTAAVYDFSFAPGERVALFTSISCRGIQRRSTVPFFTSLRRARRERLALNTAVTLVETGNTAVNEVLSRSMSDFHMLVSSTEQGLYPYAGIPWYSTTFGRDGLIAAMQMLWLDPAIARGVLKRLAALQADHDNPKQDAQPGKILHELRGGEMSALGEVPFGLYYGSVDATPLFVMLCGAFLDRTGDQDFIAAMWPHVERALAWMDGVSSRQGDGFLVYQRARDTGLSNQGWKDSFDAVFHADGTLAEGPIALVEAQAYMWAAKLAAARCAAVLKHADRAAELRAEAADLAGRFQQAFWCEAIGTYAIALDGRGRKCAVRTSNPGHALFCGLAPPEHARRVASLLLGTAFQTGWGIRTVAAGEPRYNPISYHNGSVWPHDTAIIAAGLARYGMRHQIGPLLEGLCKAASYMDHRRLPELYCGFPRKRGRGPTLYPVACSPQAWASGAPFMLIQSLLGLEFDRSAGEIRLVNPVVPEFLGHISVNGLRLGGSTVDFVVGCEHAAVSLRTLRANGAIRVALVSQPPVSP